MDSNIITNSALQTQTSQTQGSFPKKKETRGRPRKKSSAQRYDEKMQALAWLHLAKVVLVYRCEKGEKEVIEKMYKEHESCVVHVDIATIKHYVNYYSEEYTRKNSVNISSINKMSLAMMKKLRLCYEGNGNGRISLLRRAVEKILQDARDKSDFKLNNQFTDFLQVFRAVVKTGHFVDRSEFMLMVAAMALAELTASLSVILKDEKIQRDENDKKVLAGARDCFLAVAKTTKYYTRFAQKIKKMLPDEIVADVDSFFEAQDYDGVDMHRLQQIVEHWGHYIPPYDSFGFDERAHNEMIEGESFKLTAKPKPRLVMNANSNKVHRIRKTMNAMNAVTDLDELQDDMTCLAQKITKITSQMDAKDEKKGNKMG